MKREEKIQDLKNTQCAILVLIKRYTYLQDENNFNRDNELLENEISKVEKQKEKLRELQNDLHRQFFSAKEELKKLNQQLQETIKELKQLKEEPKQKERKVERLKQRIASLKEKLVNMEN